MFVLTLRLNYSSRVRQECDELINRRKKQHGEEICLTKLVATFN